MLLTVDMKQAYAGTTAARNVGVLQPLASWKIIDSKSGVVKQGKYTASDVCDPAYKKPSDLPKTNIPALLAAASASKPKSS